MTATPQPLPLPLREGSPELSHFADDYAEIDPTFTAEDLAIAYLDQCLDTDAFTGEFEDAVREFLPQCRYYA